MADLGPPNRGSTCLLSKLKLCKSSWRVNVSASPILISMRDWGMNSYLYAPKDDEKHRAYWRVMYTLEEAADLTQLIKETTEKGIHFIYALSPGLDITFSSKQEVALLKEKLDQVRCSAFLKWFSCPSS